MSKPSDLGEVFTNESYKRKWHVRDWTRVASHLLAHGVPELVLIHALFSIPEITIDDKLRQLDVATSASGVEQLTSLIKNGSAIIRFIKKIVPTSSRAGQQLSRLSLIFDMLQSVMIYLDAQIAMIDATRELIGTTDAPPLLTDYWYGPSVRPAPPTRQRNERGRFYYDR